MKVMYFTTHPPYPPYRGDQLIAFEQIKELSKKHDIFLVSIINENYDSLVEKVLGEYTKGIFLIKLNKISSFISLFKTFFNFKPFQVNMYTNFLIKRKIKSIIELINPDIIHIQTIRLGELIIKEKTPKFLDMIDVLSLNMERRSLKEKFLKRQLLRLESYLLKHYENNIIKKKIPISVVSENDLIGSHLEKKENININPNGTSFFESNSCFSENNHEEDIFLFHGNMSYFPNVEAMVYFTENVWPEISKKYPEYKLYIVGKDPVNKILKYNGKNNIIVTGFVDDISEYLNKSKVGIYPLNSGTGLQNKILEALACGLPSIASDFAIQGIKGITSNELVIANNKEEYLEAIDYLLNNENIRKEYKKNGKLFVRKNYSWKKNAEKLQVMWTDAINRQL